MRRTCDVQPAEHKSRSVKTCGFDQGYFLGNSPPSPTQPAVPRGGESCEQHTRVALNVCLQKAEEKKKKVKHSISDAFCPLCVGQEKGVYLYSTCLAIACCIRDQTRPHAYTHTHLCTPNLDRADPSCIQVSRREIGTRKCSTGIPMPRTHEIAHRIIAWKIHNRRRREISEFFTTWSHLIHFFACSPTFRNRAHLDLPLLVPEVSPSLSLSVSPSRNSKVSVCMTKAECKQVEMFFSFDKSL